MSGIHKYTVVYFLHVMVLSHWWQLAYDKVEFVNHVQA